MFTIEDRDRVREFVLQLARDDGRVVAGAVVGSLALGPGDRWSDLDLTFAVADEFSQLDVLEAWSRRIEAELGAVRLFDLPSGPSIYRVFFLPGCLQFDLSFSPASRFGASGPRFRLLFGSSIAQPYAPPPEGPELFGYAVHHLMRARFCIERGRAWQAEYWIGAGRDLALSLACLRRGLPALHGRGLDELGEADLGIFKPTLVASPDKDELLRALRCLVDALFAQTGQLGEVASLIEPQLRQLAGPLEDPAAGAPSGPPGR
jgi:hypothetical protein